MQYHADIHSWKEFRTIHFKAETPKAALQTAIKLTESNFPGADVFQLWGHGRLLWRHDENWVDISPNFSE